MTTDQQRIELKAESNSLWTLAHTARRADDPESMVLILEKLLHCYHVQVLNKKQEREEAKTVDFSFEGVKKLLGYPA
jgi:hypothetical protein